MARRPATVARAKADAYQASPYQMRGMPVPLHDRLRIEAARRRVTKEAVVILAIEAGLPTLEEEERP